jgi:hypothetical protein
MEQAMAEQQGGALSAQQKKNNVLGKGTIVPSADDLENPVRNENPALLKHIQNGAKDESEQTKRLRKLHKVLNVHGHLKTVADRNPRFGLLCRCVCVYHFVDRCVRETNGGPREPGARSRTLGSESVE